MKRLTEKFAGHYLYGDYAKENCIEESNVEWKTVQQLGRYEDTELTPREIEKLKVENEEYKQKLADGRMIELPCKVGDTVYVLIQRNVTTEIVKGTVRNIQHSYNAWWVEFSNLWVDKTFDDFGKTAFLTREQAEQALKEMEN